MEFDCANIFAQLTKRWLTALFIFDLFIWRSKLHLTPFPPSVLLPQDH
jgi:hypothetical protein